MFDTICTASLYFTDNDGTRRCWPCANNAAENGDETGTEHTNTDQPGLQCDECHGEISTVGEVEESARRAAWRER